MSPVERVGYERVEETEDPEKARKEIELKSGRKVISSFRFSNKSNKLIE